MKPFCFFLLLLPAICLLAPSCSGEHYDATNEDAEFGIDMAYSLYLKASTESIPLLTKESEKSLSNFFYRCDYEPLWSEAVSSESDDVYAVNVPTKSHSEYFALMYDLDQKAKVFKCYHELVIIKDKHTGSVGVYNRFLFSTSPLKISNYPTAGNRDGLSASEVYSTLSGRIIRYTNYVDGGVYTSIFAGNSKHNHNRIVSLLLHKVVKYVKTTPHVHTKQLDAYTCPSCGRDTFYEIGYGDVYFCSHCGYIVEADEIDSSFCYDDYGGGSGGWDNTDDPEQVNQPDPGTGNGEGGGGGQGTEPGGSNNPQEQVTKSVVRDTSVIGHQTFIIEFPEGVDIETLSNVYRIFMESITEIYSNQLLNSFMTQNCMDNTIFNFYYNPDIRELASTLRSSCIITFRNVYTPVLAEELFHIYQYRTFFGSSPDSNYEFEAKILLYLAFSVDVLNNRFSGTNYVWSSVEAYLNNRSETNKNNLRDYISMCCGYDMTTLSTLPNMTPNLDTLDHGEDM